MQAYVKSGTTFGPGSSYLKSTYTDSKLKNTSITFELNDSTGVGKATGTAVSYSDSVYFEEAVTGAPLQANTPLRSGYTFGGWSTRSDENGGIIYSSPYNDSTTVITGEEKSTLSSTVQASATNSQSGESSVYGYYLKDGIWYYPNNMTLYAYWIPHTYIVGYNSKIFTTRAAVNAGSDYNGYFDNVQSASLPQATATGSATFAGEYPETITAPFMRGYTFGGYYNSAGINTSNNTPITDNTTAVQYYSGTSGRYQSNHQTKVSKTSGTVWQDSSSKSDVLGDGEQIDIYAAYSANEYKITLDPTDYTKKNSVDDYITPTTEKQGTTSITQTYDAVIPNITVPTRPDAIFEGYYTEPNGEGTLVIDASGAAVTDVETKQIFNTTLGEYVTASDMKADSVAVTDSTAQFKFDGDITLYAKWTEISGVRAFSEIIKLHWTSDMEADIYNYGQVRVYVDGQLDDVDEVSLYPIASEEDTSDTTTSAMNYVLSGQNGIYQYITSNLNSKYEIYVNNKDTGKTLTISSDNEEEPDFTEVYLYNASVSVNRNDEPYNDANVELRRYDEDGTLLEQFYLSHQDMADGEYALLQPKIVATKGGEEIEYEVWVNGADSEERITFTPGSTHANVNLYAVEVQTRLDDVGNSSLGTPALVPLGGTMADAVFTTEITSRTDEDGSLLQGIYSYETFAKERTYYVLYLNGKETGEMVASGETTYLDYYSLTVKVTPDMTASLLPVGGETTELVPYQGIDTEEKSTYYLKKTVDRDTAYNLYLGETLVETDLVFDHKLEYDYTFKEVAIEIKNNGEIETTGEREITIQVGDKSYDLTWDEEKQKYVASIPIPADYSVDEQPISVIIDDEVVENAAVEGLGGATEDVDTVIDYYTLNFHYRSLAEDADSDWTVMSVERVKGTEISLSDYDDYAGNQRYFNYWEYRTYNILGQQNGADQAEDTYIFGDTEANDYQDVYATYRTQPQVWFRVVIVDDTEEGREVLNEVKKEGYYAGDTVDKTLLDTYLYSDDVAAEMLYGDDFPNAYAVTVEAESSDGTELETSGETYDDFSLVLPANDNAVITLHLDLATYTVTYQMKQSSTSSEYDTVQTATAIPYASDLTLLTEDAEEVAAYKPENDVEYIFTGWYDIDGEGYSDTYTVEGNAILQASWEPAGKLIFVVDGLYIEDATDGGSTTGLIKDADGESVTGEINNMEDYKLQDGVYQLPTYDGVELPLPEPNSIAA